MILTFWLLISLTIYCYFVYPLLLWLMAKLRPNPAQKGEYGPNISIVLSVWNKEMEIIIGSGQDAPASAGSVIRAFI